MSAQMKQTLAALLAAAVIAVPATADAKGGKGNGGEGAGHEQNRGGGGGGEFRGGDKHREDRQARQVPDQGAYAPRQVFEARGNGKHAHQERFAPAEAFAGGARPQKHEAGGRQRGKTDRHAERAALVRFEARPNRRQRDVHPYAFGQRIEHALASDRKFDKRAAKQQRAAYHAEIKHELRWAKQQRQVLKQSARVAPVVVYQQSFADYPRTARFADAPVYRVREAREFLSYPAYGPVYDNAPRYVSNNAYEYPGWSYPQSYSTPVSYYPNYSPYDAGYDDGGIGGLFGAGGGGLGDILAALLPLVLGDGLGLGGLTTGSLGAGLLDGSMPGLAGGYGLNDYPAVDYADPQFSYQDASVAPGLLGVDQADLGGDSMMSLVGLALGSGLLGGDSGGLGGLGGLLGMGGGLGFGDSFAGVDPNYAYADPYASNTGLLSAFGA